MTHSNTRAAKGRIKELESQEGSSIELESRKAEKKICFLNTETLLAGHYVLRPL